MNKIKPHKGQKAFKTVFGMVAAALVGVTLIPISAVDALTEVVITPVISIFLPLIQNPPAVLDTGELLITEVLYRPDASQGDIEWFEIFNAGVDAVDLRHFKVGDEETQGASEGMMQFPVGAVIWPGRIVVIAEDALVFESVYGFLPDYEFTDSGSTVPEMRKYTAWTSGSINLTNTGDELLLLDRYDDLADSVSWGSSNWAFDPDLESVSSGQSIQRAPANVDTDTAADWLTSSNPGPGYIDLSPGITPTPTPTATADPSPTPGSTDLLISEVLYDPSGAEPASEWFEIHNPAVVNQDLAGFKVGDEETQGASEGMFVFPDGAVIAAGEFLVIANNAVEFFNQYGFAPDYELTGQDAAVPDLAKYPGWSGGNISLSNAGDELLLLDQQDGIVDAVSWGNSVWAFSPSVLGGPSGSSIERYPTGVDTNSASDWRAQLQPSPGSSGDAAILSTPVP